MSVRQYQLRISVDDLLDKVFDALRHDTVVEDIVGEEIPDEPDDGRGAQVRRFCLRLYEIVQAGDFIIVGQDELAREWVSISVGDSAVLQAASRE